MCIQYMIVEKRMLAWLLEIEDDREKTQMIRRECMVWSYPYGIMWVCICISKATMGGTEW